jgi:hypothetical protein
MLRPCTRSGVPEKAQELLQVGEEVDTRAESTAVVPACARVARRRGGSSVISFEEDDRLAR